nr:Uncharacterised protein [Raoultella sp. NCTC 9187]
MLRAVRQIGVDPAGVNGKRAAGVGKLPASVQQTTAIAGQIVARVGDISPAGKGRVGRQAVKVSNGLVLPIFTRQHFVEQRRAGGGLSRVVAYAYLTDK